MPEITLTLPQAFRRAFAAFQGGRLGEAEQLCRAILGAAPGDPDTLHLLALVLHGSGQRAQALAHYDEAIAFAGENPAFHINRGNALQELNRLPEALASYDRALALQPNYPEAHCNRGVALQALACYEESLASFARAFAQRPNHAETLNNRGITLKELGRFEEALANYDGALLIRPQYVEALSNRGNVLHELRRYAEALANYDAALAIKPDYADAYVHRGNVEKALKRYDAAFASYGRALTIAPQNALVHYNGALTLQELHRLDEAVASFDRALAISPDSADALNARGNSLKHLQRLTEAAAHFDRAVAIEAEHENAFSGLADCARGLCDFDLQQRLGGEVRRRAVAGKSFIMPMVALGYSDDEALHLACAQRFAKRRFAVMPPRLWNGTAWHNQRIRIAYLSPDFRRHPVGQFIAGLIEGHDRTRFETFGISFGPDDRSELRVRLVNAFDSFVDVTAKSDREVAVLLHELRVNIAVDIAGYTYASRPEILAYRPAPITVNYLGYPATMAAPFIDYMIADPVVLPSARAAFYAENIVHLPDCFMPGDLGCDSAAATPTRREAGLPEPGFVFCCFNNHAKITPVIFDVWMRLLGAVEDSVLWLSRPLDVVASNLRGAAAARGIDPARLIFAPRVDRLADHLARQRLADVFLDTLPYNAHTTAMDALAAGLPVLTCRGGCFAARVATSLNNAIGLGDLVTDDLEDYEATALRLARDPAALAAIKARLLRNRTTSPLFDADRYHRHIEAAYVAMWELWQRGERPRPIRVAPLPDSRPAELARLPTPLEDARPGASAMVA